MPEYIVTAPDGSEYIVSGNGTAEEALAHFKSQYKPPEKATFGERSGMEPEPYGPSQGKAMGLGAATGAVPWLDEVASGVNAAVDVTQQLQGAGALPEGKSAANLLAEAYSRRLPSARRQIAETQEAHPGTFLGSQIAGGLTTAALAPARLGAVGAGALYGGVFGSGEGETLAQRLLGAGAGMGIGAGGGYLVPKAFDTLAAGGRAIGTAISPVVGRVRGVFDPSGEAERQVRQAFVKDASTGNVMPAAEQAAARAADQPLAVVDTGGESVRRLARSASNASPQAGDIIKDFVQPRFESQGSRTENFVRRLVGRSDAVGTREGLEVAARKANGPAYRTAYARGAFGLWDNQLAQLAEAPAMREAIKDATRRGGNLAASEGYKQIRNPFTVDDAGVRLTDPGVTPNLQFWDYVQRGLRAQEKGLARAGDDDGARAVGGLRRQLNAHLDNLVPDFNVARSGAARFFQAEDALEAGQKFVSSTMLNEEARRSLAKMSTPERELFAEGYATNLLEKISRVGDRRSIVNAIWGTKAAKERAEIALGKGRAAELEAYMRRETIMDLMRNAMGNSTTAQQFMALGLGGTYSLVTNDPKGMMVGALAAALKGGSSVVNQRVARRVAEMLVSEDPDMIRRATTIVARSPAIRDALRKAEDKLAGFVASHSAGGTDTLLAGPRTAIAEDSPPPSTFIQAP